MMRRNRPKCDTAPRFVWLATVLVSLIWVSEMAWGREQLLAVERIKIQNGEGYYQPVRKTSKAGVLILLDSYLHGNNPKLVKPLRRAFARQAWASLSVQVDSQQSASALIGAAYKKLKEKNKEKPVYLIAYGETAKAASDYAMNNKEQLAGLVYLSATDFDKSEETIVKIKSSQLPVLDIIAERDYQRAIEAANKRLAAWEAASQYRQVIIAGTDHFYSGQIQYLSKLVRGYLHKHKTN